MKTERPPCTPHFILTALILVTGLCAFASDKVATFSSLPRTDTIEIRFNSSGCFHDYTYDYTFQIGTTSSVSIASVKQTWSLKNKRIEESRSALGIVPLTATDLKGLDELLQFYRSEPAGGCTTVDRVTVSQLRNGKPIATEQFIDRTCCALDTNRFTTLPEIARRLKQN